MNGFSGTGSPSIISIVHIINHSHKTPVQRLAAVFSRSTPLFQSGATCRLLRITVQRFIPLELGEKLWSQNKTFTRLFLWLFNFYPKVLLLCNETKIKHENNFLLETNFIIQICLVEIFWTISSSIWHSVENISDLM